jgi:hypothetical protein
VAARRSERLVRLAFRCHALCEGTAFGAQAPLASFLQHHALHPPEAAWRAAGLAIRIAVVMGMFAFWGAPMIMTTKQVETEQ